MSATILCVDDDRHLCRILEKALEGAGYRVLTAHDGEQAQALVEAEEPDLLILDVLLPKRDGFEVLEGVRAGAGKVAGTPAFLLTGCRITPAYEERARGLGAEGLLAKPIPLDTLLSSVGRVIPPPKRRRASRGGTQKKGSGSRTSQGQSRKKLSGSFKELGFPHLLHHLHGLRATGVMMLENGKRKKAVQLRDGYPVAVQSNLVGECLGNLLVRNGLVKKAVVEESLQRVKQGEGLQGEILIAMEVLTEDQVVKALREQAEEKLFEIFEWKRGRFQLELGGRLKRGNELALEGSPATLILRGIRKRLPLERIDSYLDAHAERYVVLGESPFYRFQEIELGNDERALLDSLDGSTRVAEIARGDESLRRTIYALVATEMIDLRGRPSPRTATETIPVEELDAEPSTRTAEESREEERRLRSELAATAEKLRSQSYFEILGVDEEAGAEQASGAYEEMARRSHPDRYKGSSTAVRQLAGEVHELISTAHETLSDNRKRQLYLVEHKRGQRRAAEREGADRALQAEIEFQKGEAKLRARSYESALVHFGSALQKNPEEGEYHAHYGWTLHMMHPDDADIAQEAIEHVKRGAKMAPNRERPTLYLGRLYKAIGKTVMAERMFTRAVQLKPDCVEALRELRLINMRREKNKGLVRRLLRR